MRKFKRFAVLLTVLSTACVNMTACEKRADSSEEALDENVIITPIETTSDTSRETSTAENTSSASTENTLDIYHMPPVQLPENIADNIVNLKDEGFVYSDYLDSEYDSLALIASDDKYLYFEKWICNFSYESDLAFYKYDLTTDESTAKSYIYDMETGNYYRADNCQSLAIPNYLPHDYEKMLFLLRDSDADGTKFDLYCLYENGKISKLTDNIGIDTMIVGNGEKAVYFMNKELYIVEY